MTSTPSRQVGLTERCGLYTADTAGTEREKVGTKQRWKMTETRS